MKRNNSLNTLNGILFGILSVLSMVQHNWIDGLFFGVTCVSFATGTLTYTTD